MLSKYITQVTADKYCLQYFHFESRLFPLLYVIEHQLVMVLPQYSTNEWMIPFDIDTLFTQYKDERGKCHAISNRTFVSNKQMDNPSMKAVSYDTTNVGMDGQCRCNNQFFNEGNEGNIALFMKGFIDGYLAMLTDTGKILQNGIF